MINREAVISFQKWMTGAQFGFKPSDVFVNTAVLSFDLSVFELISFSTLGATILLNSKSVLQSSTEFTARINDNNGSVWVSTPSFAFPYSRTEIFESLSSINTFLFCGEVLPHAVAKGLKENYSSARVLNTYGPTEATVATTFIEITKEILDKESILPVGIAKTDSEVYITEGEVIIKGPHVSIGYVNEPELNSQKFFIDNGTRAFRTGDYGELKNEMLYFTGRNDDLVKLHGYRIELNEITSALLKIAGVLQAETIALKRNGITKKIVSLVVLEKDNGISTISIKEKLTDTLPHYILPSDIKIVSEIKLNQNGKADKKELQRQYLAR